MLEEPIRLKSRLELIEELAGELEPTDDTLLYFYEKYNGLEPTFVMPREEDVDDPAIPI